MVGSDIEHRELPLGRHATRIRIVQHADLAVDARPDADFAQRSVQFT